MTKIQMTALAAALALGLSGGAFGVTKAEYKAGKDEISAKYKSDKEACKAMTGNARDVCTEEAKGREKAAKAELENSYKPSDRNANDVKMAKAKADYEVAKEKCDDKTGNDKDVCKKDAQAAYIAAKGDAKVSKKMADASATPAQKSAAKQDAREDRKDAGYSAAKERCDALTGDAKDNCIKQAKAKFGQS